jgi:hypothetical protein
MIPSADDVLANPVFPLLLALALLLPFEAARPLFSLGPLGITSLELPLYTLVAVHFLRRSAWRPSTWTPVHWAAIVWAAAHLASAAAADGDRGQALRFALRMSVGAALVFPVAAETRIPDRAARVFQALVAGATLSAAMGLAEALIPAAGTLLAPFRAATVHVGDVIRASGPFPYPNPAALYWGAALPLVLAIGSRRDDGESKSTRWPAVASGGLLVMAIVASGSRGAILTTAVVLASLLVVAPLPWRRATLRALALLGVTVVLASTLRPALILRDSRTSGEAPWFAGQFRPLAAVPVMVTAEEATVRVQVENKGALRWERDGPTPMGISAQWIDADGRIAHEEPATKLPAAVAPGSSVVVDAEVTAPERPGPYTLHWQLALGGTSFEAVPAAGGDTSIEVTGTTVTTTRVWPAPRPTQRQTNRPELWRAGWRMWQARPYLGVGPDGFRRAYGAYLGPRALDDRVNANSLYLETLADLGLAGASALTFAFFAPARVVRRSWRTLPEPGRRLALGSAAALLAFALHGLVDCVWAMTPLHGLFWIHAGLLVGIAEAYRTPTA